MRTMSRPVRPHRLGANTVTAGATAGGGAPAPSSAMQTAMLAASPLHYISLINGDLTNQGSAEIGPAVELNSAALVLAAGPDGNDYPLGGALDNQINIPVGAEAKSSGSVSGKTHVWLAKRQAAAPGSINWIFLNNNNPPSGSDAGKIAGEFNGNIEMRMRGTTQGVFTTTANVLADTDWHLCAAYFDGADDAYVFNVDDTDAAGTQTNGSNAPGLPASISLTNGSNLDRSNGAGYAHYGLFDGNIIDTPAWDAIVAAAQSDGFLPAPPPAGVFETAVQALSPRNHHRLSEAGPFPDIGSDPSQGTLAGGTVQAIAGDDGGSYPRFGASNDGISVPGTATMCPVVGGGTIAGLVYFDSVVNNVTTLWDRTEKFLSYFNGSGDLVNYNRASGQIRAQATVPWSPTLNTWHLVVIRYFPTAVPIVTIDGVDRTPNATVTPTNNLATGSDANLYGGYVLAPASLYMTGGLAHVAQWDRPLTNQEVIDLHTAAVAEGWVPIV